MAAQAPRRTKIMATIGPASASPDVLLALVGDLQGPKLRVGELPEPVRLGRGDEAVISFEPVASDGAVPIMPAVLGEVLRPGHDLLIDDGHVQLKVDEVEGGRDRCTVLVGGVVTAHKGVNVPGVPVP